VICCRASLGRCERRATQVRRCRIRRPSSEVEPGQQVLSAGPWCGTREGYWTTDMPPFFGKLTRLVDSSYHLRNRDRQGELPGKTVNSGVGPGKAGVASNGKKALLVQHYKIANGVLIPEVFHPLKICFLSCFQYLHASVKTCCPYVELLLTCLRRRCSESLNDSFQDGPPAFVRNIGHTLRRFHSSPRASIKVSITEKRRLH
jgi:hypothetical protein